MSKLFQRELATYERNRIDLLKTALGKYAVISGDDVHGTFPTFEEALRTGYNSFEPGHFMVKEISEPERVEFVSCAVRLACPA